METNNGNLDLMDPFRLGFGDSKRFKRERKGNTVMVKRKMERSENRGATMHKDRLLSFSLSLSLKFAFHSLASMCFFSFLLSIV